MATISTELKEALGYELVKFYRRYGKVSPRKPYKDDDSGGGAGLLFESHPLLDQQPIGASSDLTFLANENSETVDAAQERANECNEELKKQPVIAQALQQQIFNAPSANQY